MKLWNYIDKGMTQTTT